MSGGSTAADVAERRRRRAKAQQVFDAIATEYRDLPEVGGAAMFGSNGLRCRDKLFAFVGGDGELIVKLPAAHAAALVAEAQAEVVRIGRHGAREWVSVPHPDAPGRTGAWRDLITAAQQYASRL